MQSSAYSPCSRQDRTFACPRAETALFFRCNVFFCCVLIPGEIGRRYPAWDGLGVFWRIFGILIFIITFTIVIPSENEAVHLMGNPHNKHAQVELLYISYPRVSLTTVGVLTKHFFSFICPHSATVDAGLPLLRPPTILTPFFFSFFPCSDIGLYSISHSMLILRETSAIQEHRFKL